MQSAKINLKLCVYITALVLASPVALSYAQTSAPIPPNQTNATVTGNTTTGIANTTTLATLDFETARQRYLEAWNQTEFHALFSAFVEPYSEQGFGLYTDHPSDVFKPGDTITFYVEPVGFSHKPVLNEQGKTLYQVNLTAKAAVEDQAGNLLATIDNFEPFVATSHNKNTEIYMTVTVTQEQPFPEGAYKLTYTIVDNHTGENFVISKNIRIAQTVTS